MPVIKSAKKKLKVDKKRASANKKVKVLVEKALKKAYKTPTPKSVQNAFSVVDKAVKNRIIHKNKASRLKSRLSKLLGPTKTQAKKPKKNKK